MAAGAVSLSLLASPAIAASPDSASEARSVASELSGTPRAEIPTKVASMVVRAQGKDREQQTEAIIRAAVDAHPTSASTIVGASCKWSPDLAPLIAVSATSRQPKQLIAIARAAAAAAPSQAESIVEALCKQNSARFGDIALAVSDSVPGMDRSILAAVTKAVPSLKVFFARATESLSADKGFVQSVSVVLAQVERDLKNSAPALKTTVPQLIREGVATTQYAMLPSPPMPLPPKKNGPNPRLLRAFTRLPGGDDDRKPLTREDTEERDPAGPRNYSKP